MSGGMRTPQNCVAAKYYIDGEGHLGTSKSFTFPKMEEETEERNSGGLGKKIPLGILKALEADLTIEEASEAVANTLAVGSNAVIEVKASLKQGGKSVAVRALLKGTVTALDLGTLEEKKTVEAKIKMSLNFYELEIGGQPWFLIDTENLIWEVRGKDRLAEVRNNL